MANRSTLACAQVVPPNLSVNTDRHRRAFGPAWQPVTLVR